MSKFAPARLAVALALTVLFVEAPILSSDRAWSGPFESGGGFHDFGPDVGGFHGFGGGLSGDGLSDGDFGSGSGSGGGGDRRRAGSFVVPACAWSTDDETDCAAYMGESLARELIDQQKMEIVRKILVKVPLGVPNEQEMTLLRDIEFDAIEHVSDILKDDVARLQPFWFNPFAGERRQEAIAHSKRVEALRRQARIDAATDRHWTDGGDDHSYEYHLGHAFGQAVSIAANGW